MVCEYGIIPKTNNDWVKKYTNIISIENAKETLDFNDIYKNKCELLYSKI